MTYNPVSPDAAPSRTLLQMRTALNLRLGMGAQGTASPGHNDLLTSFLVEAQELLYRRYELFRTERFFSWAMVVGQRHYNFTANLEGAPIVDPRKISWVGRSTGTNSWTELACGIDPRLYTTQGNGLPSRYEIRQAIELWPAPNSAALVLRIKGDFGLLAFAADTDVTTVDHQAIALLALANAKAHFGQPDAANYMGQLTTYLGDLTAGSHHTRRYLPGGRKAVNVAPPVMV